MTTKYRIRWAQIYHMGFLKRLCLAEKRINLLFLGFYWPLPNGNWRETEAEALRDIEADKELNAPLPQNKEVN